MAFETEYANFVNPLSVVIDAASENLVSKNVWLQHVLRVPMPTESQSLEIAKKGSLGRLVVPENTAYTYGSYSEYLETSTLLNAIKSAVISKATKEAQKFGRREPFSVIGEEQGKALSLGADEDIATLAAGFTSSVTAAGTGATQLDLQACALDVQIATNGHAAMDGPIVAVLHPKTAFEIGVVNVLDPTAGALPVFGNSGSTSGALLEGANRRTPQGFAANQYGVQIFTTNVIDDDGTNYMNLVFDASRALVGFWDDAAQVDQDLDIENFRNRIATCWFTDFAIHYDEAGCRLEAPIL